MREIGAFEAKTNLSHILAEVAKGEQFVITKHGHKIALLIPVESKAGLSVSQAIAGIKQLNKKIAKRGIKVDEILKMRDEGRK